MICVGLDWGRESHRFAIAAPGGALLGEGVVPNKTFSFEPWAREVESHGGEVRLTVESGNGCSTTVEKVALSRGWEVTRVTATAVKAYREHVMGINSKTDEIDARAIALLGLNSAQTRERSQSRLALRKATRDRDRLSKDKTRILNRLRQALAEVIPELTTRVISHLDRPPLLHLLMHHPDPADWVKLGVDGLQQLLKAARLRTKKPYLQKLVDGAATFQNVLDSKEQSIRLVEIKMLARRVKNAVEEMAEVEQYLALLTADDEHVHLLDTIDGAALVLASSIVSEIIDIKDFQREAKLASYAGLGLKKHQTGKSADYWLPQRKANRRLKHYLMQLASGNAQLNARSAAYVQKKIAEGKKPLQARRALARQLVRVIHSMLTKSKPYS